MYGFEPQISKKLPGKAGLPSYLLTYNPFFYSAPQLVGIKKWGPFKNHVAQGGWVRLVHKREGRHSGQNSIKFCKMSSNDHKELENQE